MNPHDIILIRKGYGDTNEALWTQELRYTANGRLEYNAMAPMGTKHYERKWVIEKLIYDASNRMITILHTPAYVTFTNYETHEYK